MERKAILIESSKLKGNPTLDGAKADVHNLNNFLLSNVGGAWNDNEIEILHNPSTTDLLVQIEYAKNDDYLLISFSGHGYMSRGETFLCLNDDDEISVSSIRPHNDRVLCIIDACRGITEREPSALKSMMEKFAKSYVSRSKYREIYDLWISRSERGQIVVYSCGTGESAGETNNGGYFSKSLIDCAEEWNDLQDVIDLQSQCYDVWQAFQCAEGKTQRRAPQQNPEYHAGRRLHHFPFAVWVKNASLL